MGKYVFYIAILLSVFLFVIKPVIGLLKGKGGSMPIKQIKDIKDVYVASGATGPGTGGATAENNDALPGVFKAQPALVSALKDKDLVKSIIKEWVKEGM